MKEAVASRDVSQLRAFLNEAKLLGLDTEDPDSVQVAQELLEELEHQATALEGLATAIKAPIDEQALREALKAAEASGVGKRELAEGRRALEAEMKRTAAKDSLKTASGSDDPATLQAAISQGEQAGLSQNELAAAKDVLSVLEKQSLAKQELRDAMDSRDPKVLTEAIRFGQDVGLSEKQLAGAFRIQKQLRQDQAQKDLQLALDSRDREVLLISLMNAVDKDTGLGEHNFKVKAVREILEEEEWKDMALQGLCSACASDSIHALQFALDEARTASVPLRDIANARECFKTLVLHVLQDAIESRDSDKLEDALDSADAAGLGYDDPTVCTATAVLQEELRRKKAVEGLHVACSAKDSRRTATCFGRSQTCVRFIQ